MNIRQLLILYLTFAVVHGQLDTSKLRPIGVIKGVPRNYRIQSGTSIGRILVKLVPNVPANITCGADSIRQYEALIDKILKPVSDVISLISQDVVVEEGNTTTRFVGAVIGTIALGVATGAAITAGIALDRANKAAKDIANLKEAITQTNEAVKSLKTAAGRTLTLVNGLQDQINNDVIPAINSLGCDVANARLGIMLTQYYTTILTVFGPSLQNPVFAPVTIQALSQLMNGDLSRLLTTMGYNPEDLSDVLTGEMITGSITLVNLEQRYMVMEISVPELIQVNNAVVVPLHTITFASDGKEFVTTVPDMVIQRGPLISGLKSEKCMVGRSSVICSRDESFALSSAMTGCLQGDVKLCVREHVITSFAPRFIISDNKVVANCLAALCSCASTGRPIVQERTNTLTEINRDKCSLVSVDGLVIRPGKELVNVTYSVTIEELGPIISLVPVDNSAIIGQIQDDLDKAQVSLDKSQAALDRVNPAIVNDTMIIVLIVLAVLFIIGLLCAYIWLSILTKRMIMNNDKFTSALNHQKNLYTGKR